MLTAADAIARIVRDVPAGVLDAPTPAAEWDVRATLNHVVFWTARGESAARKEQPPAEPGEDHDFTADPGYAAAFAEQAHRTAAAWQEPAAREGSTSLTGSAPGLPATVIGGMILGEWVLHGWDLAVAAGLPHGLDDAVVRAAYDSTAAIADMGRQYGAFGPEVAVPADAPPLDRLLGLSGRDPRWTP
ncbi:TIGR03086 family metal-binding protein [Actinomadura flavalba]|uniref:TIGR03086 family metal-binding protein n=1 Tax=Actinomadura flavalba TaxID=1120938 RepID=UPI00052531D2|nr:TIGR03086 family metal-binding protein [Actinomadura flavalba]